MLSAKEEKENITRHIDKKYARARERERGEEKIVLLNIHRHIPGKISSDIL